MVEAEAARDGGVQARHVQAVGEGSEPKSGREGNSLPWLGRQQRQRTSNRVSTSLCIACVLCGTSKAFPGCVRAFAYFMTRLSRVFSAAFLRNTTPTSVVYLE